VAAPQGLTAVKPEAPPPPEAPPEPVAPPVADDVPLPPIWILGSSDFGARLAAPASRRRGVLARHLEFDAERVAGDFHAGFDGRRAHEHRRRVTAQAELKISQFGGEFIGFLAVEINAPAGH